MNKETLIEVKNLTHRFSLSRKIAVNAVNDVSFQIYKGEILGLVGESGSGKSTIARCLMNIYTPTAGKILYKGINIHDPGEFRQNKKLLQTRRQIIFQDSASSLNPRMKSSRYYCRIAEDPSYYAASGNLPERGGFSDAVCRS